MKKVKIYTTPVCVYCITMKDFFEKNKIEFDEIDILEDQKEKEEIIKRSGLSTVPIIEIDGKFYTVADKKKIKEVLKIT